MERLELLDFYVAELYQTGGSAPYALLFIIAAMVLQSDWPGLGNIWKASLIENGFPIEDYRQALTLHGDVKGIPFANRFVGFGFRRNTRSDFRILLIVAVAIDLSGADVPGPYVDLRLV